MRLPPLKSAYRPVLLAATGMLLGLFLLQHGLMQRMQHVSAAQARLHAGLAELHAADAAAGAAAAGAPGAAAALPAEQRRLRSLARTYAAGAAGGSAYDGAGIGRVIGAYAARLGAWAEAGAAGTPPAPREAIGAILAATPGLEARRAALARTLMHVDAGVLLAQLFLLAAISTLILRPLRSELTAAARQLEAQERRDAPTGLPNAAALEERLATATAAGADPRLAAFMLKFVPLGRSGVMLDDAAFHRLMRAIGERLGTLARGEDFLAFCGQGKFCYLRRLERDDPGAPRFLERLERAFADPIRIGDHRFPMRIRAGVAHAEAGDAPAALIDRVQVALDRALETRAKAPVVYTPELGFEAEQRKALVRDLNAGIGRGEIRAHFQPQVHLATGRVVGFEALIRWYHPTRGVLSPFFFLPLAEKSGLDDILAEIMVAEALGALRTWDRGGLVVPQVGLNFSASQLANPRLVDQLKWRLDAEDVAPQRLAVEVLETIPVDSETDPIAVNLRGLSELGCRIDLDDFGTGFASISGLRRFRADRIKIDRSFISRIDNNLENQKMVGIMVSMAKGLNLEVLAEGVETQAEAEEVRRLGCKTVQGYLVAKPMALSETHEWLAAHDRSCAERREARRSIAV